MEPQSPSRNARNIHLRNIRAVFNEAIDDEVTTFYPFRRFQIKNVPTRKRNLKVEDFRKFINFPCERHAQKYLDMFKLMFMLIGINIIDLCNLKEIDSEGRINKGKEHKKYEFGRQTSRRSAYASVPFVALWVGRGKEKAHRLASL